MSADTASDVPICPNASAAVLRNPNLRPVMEEDVKRMQTLLEEIESAGGSIEEDPPTPTQLSLF